MNPLASPVREHTVSGVRGKRKGCTTVTRKSGQQKNPKLVRGARLFHAKLVSLLAEREWSQADLSRRLGLHPEIVRRWLDPEDPQIPNGVYACWVMQVFEVTPTDMVGELPPQRDLAALAAQDEDLLAELKVLERKILQRRRGAGDETAEATVARLKHVRGEVAGADAQGQPKRKRG